MLIHLLNSKCAEGVRIAELVGATHQATHLMASIKSDGNESVRLSKALSELNLLLFNYEWKPVGPAQQEDHHHERV